MNAREMVGLLLDVGAMVKRVGQVKALKAAACPELKLFLHRVLDPSFNYYLTTKKIPEPSAFYVTEGHPPSLTGLFGLLGDLHDRKITGKLAEDTIANWLNAADPYLRELFTIAIDRKLPGGVGRTVVNSAFPKLIYKQVYPGVRSWDAAAAQKMFDRGADVCWQRKEDGLALMIDTGTREVRTRQGQDVGKQLAPYLHEFYLSAVPGYVLFCEAKMVDAKTREPIPRPKANGNYNALFKSERKFDGDQLWFTILDCVPVENWYGHKRGGRGVQWRLERAHEFVDEYNIFTLNMPHQPYFEIVKSIKVDSLDEARDLTQREIADGGEGGIIKDMNLPFKNGKSGFKMKNEFECTLKVTGYKAHAKQAGWVGSLLCESADGKISTYVGSGLNEEDDHELNRTLGFEPFEGCLVEVRAEKISKNNALDLPRIVAIRHDKAVADTYEEVKQALADSLAVTS